MILLKKSLLITAFLGCLFTAQSQRTYWQQEVNFNISVTLNDTDHTLDAEERIEYINHSPDTLRFIWFHLWPNAYKTDRTRFSDQLLEAGDTRFYFTDEKDRGYINRLDFRVNDQPAATEDHPTHIDIIKLLLPSPLAPGARVIINTPFHVKLPLAASRSGHVDQSYLITQWYPKPAVYDAGGWHPMPYLDQGEFFSEFGRFDVIITLPQNYVVAATGELVDAPKEERFLESRASYHWEPVIRKVKTRGGGIRKITESSPASASRTKTLRYTQDRVHDFAWFADKRFIVRQDTCVLPAGKIVRARSFFLEENVVEWDQALRYVKQGLRHYSSRIGDYPYDHINVVQGPEDYAGGMEYPGVTIVAPQDPELTIVHEVGHNWFYAALASNERDHPWMDEGINTYYEQSYAKEYGLQISEQDLSDLEHAAAEKRDQPIETASDSFSARNYGLIAYYKTAAWMRELERALTTPVFDSAMQVYYREWRFRHPSPGSFREVMERSAGRPLDTTFGSLTRQGLLPSQQKQRGITFITPFSGLALEPPIRSHTKEQLILLPAFGINNYDKFMLGGMLTNFNRPSGGLQFLAAPLYAFGSRKLSGTGALVYSWFPDRAARLFQRIDLGLAGSMFSINKLTDETGARTWLRVRKLVPGLKLTRRQASPLSTRNEYVQFRSFLFREDELGFSRDTLIQGVDTLIRNRFARNPEDRYLNQLRLVLQDRRALYPYKGELKMEQADQFVRAAFTGNYFFNYSVKEGLDVRLFAGKFFYTNGRTVNREFDTRRFHLNMSGPNGYEDYTYSDYFAGRNEFEGTLSQQIMVRDGAFKVRTDLLADKVGRTDDWLVAMNLRSSIPDRVNPLALLPFRIPVKVFADIGTYADAWKRNANLDRFLFDAGFEIALIKETVHIYVPIVYSSIYRDYFKSLPEQNSFFRRISFAIDLPNLDFRKFDPNATY